MKTGLVECSRCKASLLAEAFNTPDFILCPSCQASIQITAFPALYRPQAPAQHGEWVLVEGESSCFYHPQKRAVVPCNSCGRFLCALCDMELNGEHLCPACLDTGKRKGKITHLENRRTLSDSIALSTAIIPLLFWPVTIVTAPIAIYFAVRSWKTPSSIIPRTKIRAILAILIALGELALWMAIVFAIFSARKEVLHTQ